MIETQIIGEQVAGESTKVKRELEGLIQVLHSSTFDIMDCLLKIKKNKWYVPDFETFADFLKSLDIKQRKARYLVQIAEVMDMVGIPRNTYEPIGIAKLREICSLDPASEWINPDTKEVIPMKDFITGLTETAVSKDFKDIQKEVKVLKGFKVDDFIPKTFSWLKETKEKVIDPAIEKAKMHLGNIKEADGTVVDPSDSRAIEAICAEYLITEEEIELEQEMEEESA